MKTQIVLLVILAFLQSTILPFSLALVFLLLKAYLFNQKLTLYQAFFIGLFLSLLLNFPLGFISILYVLLVQLMHAVSRFAFASNILVLFPLLFVGLAINKFVLAIYLGESFNLFPGILIEVCFALPLYILLRLLDEKLNIKNSLKI